MGCTATKDDMNKEEHCILLGEESLSYSTKTCREVDNSHRKYSFTGKINTLQFSEVTKRLYLSVYISPSDKLQTFYNFFKTDDDNYSLSSLLVLGLLLSSGKTTEKARILFEIEDKLNSKTLLRENVQKLAREMIKISCEYLPSLYMTNEVFKVDEENMKKYVNMIKQNIEKSVDLMTRDFMGGNGKDIKLGDFVNNFRIEETAKLLKPHFIRKYVLQNTKTVEELLETN